MEKSVLCPRERLVSERTQAQTSLLLWRVDRSHLSMDWKQDISIR